MIEKKNEDPDGLNSGNRMEKAADVSKVHLHADISTYTHSL